MSSVLFYNGKLVVPKGQELKKQQGIQESIQLDGFDTDLLSMTKKKLTLKGKIAESIKTKSHFETLYNKSRDQTKSPEKAIVPPKFFFHDSISNAWWEVDSIEKIPKALNEIPQTHKVYKSLSSPKFVPSLPSFIPFSEDFKDGMKIALVAETEYAAREYLIKSSIDDKYYTLGAEFALKKAIGTKHVDYVVGKHQIAVCILDTSMWVKHVKQNASAEQDTYFCYVTKYAPNSKEFEQNSIILKLDKSNSWANQFP